ncbi:MAG: VOC family protein [Acidobacteria bacterium]|nr:VOC family protein [Acidobacteriota bacterium]
MSNLRTVEIKAFVPAKDHALSKRFYGDLGFTMASDGGGVAYFHHGDCSFLLQDYYQEGLANNLMMHLLVEDVDAWHADLRRRGIAETYGVKMTEPEDQPWRIRDFALVDPSGVMWRIGQNLA